jgi:DNA polymerase-3 subunit alpha
MNMAPNDFLSDFEGLNIPIPGVRLPNFDVIEEHKKLVEKDPALPLSSYQFLRELCLIGFKNLKFKKGDDSYKKYAERVKYELDMINELGFVNYFLLVWDVIAFCGKNNIPTGLGRGSAAGSLVLYLIGVTRIDPLKYGLYFERFISKIRAKKQTINGIDYIDGSLAPDVDLDISYYRRDEVINYLKEKYKGKTCKILTLNSLSGKLLIKEMGKIVGNKSEEEMTHVSSLIGKLHGVVEDVEETYKTNEEFKKWCDDNKRVYDTALKLKDLFKNASVHASGMIVSYHELDGTFPTQLTSDKELVSSYDMNWASLVTIKLDILGLRCVSVIDDVCKQLNIKVGDIDLNDSSIYLALQDLKTPHGIFQIECDTAFKATQKVKPKTLEEISAVLALARPGAMQFIDKYANFTNTGTIESIHPFLDDIFKKTASTCIYQEQLMQALNKIGFTLDESETCRKIVGKKQLDKVKEWEEKIKNKVKEKNLPKEVAEIVWKILNDSASYSFNFSHSISYAALSAITLYLKFNHPKEFYLSLLRMTKNEPDPIGEISKIHKEMHYFGIKLLSPSLTKSQMDFSIEGKDIRFGLSSIKGISEKTIEKLQKFKKEHINKFEVFQSAKECGLSVGHLAALIQAGTLEDFGKARAKLVYEAQLYNILLEKEKIAATIIGPKFDFNLVSVVKELVANVKNEKGKPLIKESRFETIKRNTEKFKKIYEQNSISQDFANYFYTTRLIGYNPEKTLREIFLPKCSSLRPIKDVVECPANINVDFIGEISEVKMGTSKNGNKYAKYIIGDETDSVKVMIFSENLKECESLNTKLPKEEDVVIVKGKRIGEDVVFAHTVACQQNEIFTKLSQFKEEED